ncbi:RES family NAD+ phosphorylase [Chromobacterium sp. S0633]|uniref:RES family NAD+ phosphorylase n=1 Tax=Chromobacterium sp. S0633 TaxID=2957805 RepID=UPI00209D85D2|nr:RES family NAD+ phosphorylase [Chromobacterium sp. S0633]MCP1289760.1 RES family NAD+ phosphorylase [Chromobacterium sp. S0633]
MRIVDTTKTCVWMTEYGNFAHHVKVKQRYVWDQKTREFLDKVKAVLIEKEKVLQKGFHLFRAQIGIEPLDGEHPPRPFDKDRMIPNAEYVGDGRANSRGIPVLYLAERVDTAISELRPWRGADISVAVFEIVRDLRLIDLRIQGPETHGNLWVDLNGNSPSEDVKNKMTLRSVSDAFSMPVNRSDNAIDYVPTQIITEMLKNEGFDGVVFRSQFGGANVVLFNSEDAKALSCTPYQVEEVTVAYKDIGPIRLYDKGS